MTKDAAASKTKKEQHQKQKSTSGLLLELQLRPELDVRVRHTGKDQRGQCSGGAKKRQKPERKLWANDGFVVVKNLKKLIVLF